MTEIHAFDPDGTPSPGAQAALDAATAGLATQAQVNEVAARTDDYRRGPENLFAGENAGAAGDPDATAETAGSAGGYENVLIGPQAGATNARGWKNTAVGAFAMRDNVDGYFNVAVGNSALERTKGGVGDAPKSDNDPGARNTAVGSNALRYNETGRANVAIGRNSAHSNLTGSYITAVGTNAYSGVVDGETHSSKTADEVTAVGWGAGFYTNAPKSTALGVRALYQSADPNSYGGTAVGNRALEKSEARENTAVGNQAGQNVTTGRWNLALGARALGAGSAGVTGNANMAIGTAPMQQVTTGQYNVAIGQEALNPIQTGSYNTAVGHQATMSAAEGTTGGTAIGAGSNASHTNSVALGRNSATTAGDQLAIGRRHIEIGKAYGAPAAPASGVRMWAEGNGAATVLKAIFPDGRIATLA